MKKQKRYYKIGETVFIKTEKVLGRVKELNVKPKENVYEAIVEVIEGEQKGAALKVNLWEIDKNKRVRNNSSKGVATLIKTPKRPTILFAKVKPNAIIPTKDEENAGYDIYACLDEDYIVLQPHETKLIPTGIASSVTDDWTLIVKERGSTGSKGMGVRAGVVDSSFRGEIFIVITNENDKNLVIAKDGVVTDDKTVLYPASKAIAQLLLVPVPKAKVKEITYDELKAIPSKRGTGALGSSNK